ncbi:MAG: hypothetical protein FJW39_23170 [Acidobacteria bacterium]|nr:hypothetical protein [Acidobacteriota bacterium]
MRLGALLLGWALVPCLAFELRLGRAAVQSGPSEWVKVLLFEQGDTRAAVITLDSGEMDASGAAAIRKLAEPYLPPANVLIASTKSGAGKPNTARAAEALKLAAADLAPVRILAGLGKEESVSFYRRYLMRDGAVRQDPARGSEIVQPAGEIDSELRLIRFDAPNGTASAVIVNFPLNADATGYPAHLSRLLGKLYGPTLVSLVTAGAAANLAPADARSRESAQGWKTGAILAGEAVKTWVRCEPAEPSRLIVVREPGSEVMVIALSPALAIAALPGDLFTELGRAIKRASPFAATVVVSLAGVSAGMIPSKKAFQEGALDPQRVRVEPGAGEQLAETALRMLAAARRQITAR